MRPKSKPPAGWTLADEIRASEDIFVKQAVALFRERMQMEYPRLRGYAAESGLNRVELDVRLRFNFDPLLREIEVACETQPRFRPAPGRATRRVAMPTEFADG